jgi:hypothetical protein
MKQVPVTESSRASCGLFVTADIISMRAKLHEVTPHMTDPEIVAFGLHYFDAIFTPKLLGEFIETIPDNRSKHGGQRRTRINLKMHAHLWCSMTEIVERNGVAGCSRSHAYSAVVVAAYCARLKQPAKSADFEGFLHTPVLKIAGRAVAV